MRKINNRTIFFAVTSAIFGVSLSSYQNAVNIACTLGIFLLFFILVYHLLSGGDGVPRIVVACFMLAFFVFGICLGEASSLIYSYSYQYASGEVVCEIAEVSDDNFVGKNIYVDGEWQGGKVLVYFEDAEFYQVGDVVTFEGSLTPIEIFENGELNYYYSSGIQYRSTISYISSSYRHFTVKNYIKAWVLSACENMFEDNSGIAYAMIFGDSSLVDYSSLSLLRRGGVAHIFAVSGLHIGLLYGVLRMFSWLKLRSTLREKAVFNGLCLAVLLFYVYLCDFTASSMRAFLMICMAIVVTRFGLVRDRLSVISAVAFILLLYSPYIIFSVGFQLSFLTVLGLAMLPEKLEKLLAFLRWKKLIKALAFGIAACVSTLLVSCYHFGYLSTISVFLNLAVVPIYSLVYIANLVGLLIYAACEMLSLDMIANAITPYFTNYVYSLTITGFEKIEEIIPLAFYITIPTCVVIAFHGIIYANSSLISDAVNKKRKIALCCAFAVATVTPSVLGTIEIDRAGINFFVTDTQVLTIETQSETVIFCQSGGYVDLTEVATENVSIVVYDNYYKDISITDTSGYNINLYATFFESTPDGASTLYEFQGANGEVMFVGYQTVRYQGVTFQLGDSVVVTDSAKTTAITNNGYEYYIIDGVFTNNISYTSER